MKTEFDKLFDNYRTVAKLEVENAIKHDLLNQQGKLMLEHFGKDRLIDILTHARMEVDLKLARLFSNSYATRYAERQTDRLAA